VPRDNAESSAFLTRILGLPPAQPLLHSKVVELGNGVAMDFMAKEGEVAPQHYAFLVGDDETASPQRSGGLTCWEEGLE
jgi:hypothetical protein